MTETLLRELSGKIVEVYDLDLAMELTEIFEDLTEQINEDSNRYFNLAKKLAVCEKDLDKERYVKKNWKEAWTVGKLKGKHLSKNFFYSSSISSFGCSSIGGGGALATFSYFFRVLFQKAI